MKETNTKNFFYSIITIIVAVCLLNAVSKIVLIYVFDEDKPYFFKFDGLLGWRGIANKNGSLWSVGKEKMFSVSLNSDGFRDDKFELKRTPGKKRIAVVGDSFMWGYGVQQGETVPAILEKVLKKAEIFNFGINGYSTDQEYLLIKNFVIKFKPDIIILSTAFNDLESNVKGTNIYSSVYHKPVFKVIKEDTLELVSVPNVSNKNIIVGGGETNRSGLKRFAIIRLYIEVVNRVRLLLNPPDTVYDFPSLTLTRQIKNSEPLYGLFGAILKEIKKTCDDNNVTLVMMLVTDSRQLHKNKIERIIEKNNYSSQDYDLSMPNKNISRIARSLNIPAVDLFPVMQELEKNGRSGHYPVDVHYNSTGTHAAAEALSKFLVDNSLL